jgi:lipoprotein-anchoring transpeptidase ErfK/SrfK
MRATTTVSTALAARWLALVAAALAGVLLAGCGPADSVQRTPVAVPAVHPVVPSSLVPSTSATPEPSPPVTATPSTPSTSPAVPAGSGAPVHIKLFGGDGQTYGVAMPMIAYLSRKITDATGFDRATTVTVNGRPAAGAWYFEPSALIQGYPLEAHYRTQGYWPAHASIELTLDTQGVSGGPGLVYDDSLTESWHTGRADLLSVDGATLRLTVTSDGRPYGTFPVSLGAVRTPTLLGTKVIMEKDRDERMIGPGYDEIVPWSLRLTNSGEFLHAAPWNVRNIGHRSTSNGCTNLLPADAEKLFDYLQIGDPVTYTHVAGPVMQVWDGYGDWNVPWSAWIAGGAVSASGG